MKGLNLMAGDKSPCSTFDHITEVLVKAPAYRAGTSAFYDAFTHILPCTVLEVLEEGDGIRVTSGKLRVRVDEDRGPYRKGEELEVTGFHTYPRSHRIQRQYKSTINPAYRWVK